MRPRGGTAAPLHEEKKARSRASRRFQAPAAHACRQQRCRGTVKPLAVCAMRCREAFQHTRTMAVRCGPRGHHTQTGRPLRLRSRCARADRVAGVCGGGGGGTRARKCALSQTHPCGTRRRSHSGVLGQPAQTTCSRVAPTKALFTSASSNVRKSLRGIPGFVLCCVLWCVVFCGVLCIARSHLPRAGPDGVANSESALAALGV